jgi:hypothetical protein
MLLPVVVMPAGPSVSGLPVGVQVVGPFLSTLSCFRLLTCASTAMVLTARRRSCQRGQPAPTSAVSHSATKAGEMGK